MRNGLLKTAKRARKEHEWQREHDRTAPKVGDLAPDFTLYDLTGRTPVTFSSFRGRKPVVLIFGSST